MYKILFTHGFKINKGNLPNYLNNYLKINNLKVLLITSKEFEYYDGYYDSELIDKEYLIKVKNGRKHEWLFYNKTLTKSLLFNDEINEHFGENGKGILYIIKSKYGYKIGKTKSLKSRNYTFNVKLPFDWNFHKIYVSTFYSEYEKYFHSKFENINGEWFMLNEDDFNFIDKFYIETQYNLNESILTYEHVQVFL